MNSLLKNDIPGSGFPKISFGIIVLNGEPFIKYNLMALYPYAHQIIIVEGANANSFHQATPEGHSIDGTLAVIREFKENEDLLDKILLVTAEDDGHVNGFWPGEKDEQSQAYAKRATGDWLWQIDIDEFYLPEDILAVSRLLIADPTISTITFPEIAFWGSFNFICDGPFLRAHYSKFHRLFKWDSGYKYVTHRPPTVVDESGVNLRMKHSLTDEDMKKRGIFLYHYCQLFDTQVKHKMKYYSNRLKESPNPSIRDIHSWYNETFCKFQDYFHVHTVNSHVSWLKRFNGTHPSVIDELRNAIQQGLHQLTSRDMSDVEVLVDSKKYKLRIKLIMFYYNILYSIKALDRLLRDFVRKRITFRVLCLELYEILKRKRFIF